MIEVLPPYDRTKPNSDADNPNCYNTNIWKSWLMKIDEFIVDWDEEPFRASSFKVDLGHRGVMLRDKDGTYIWYYDIKMGYANG